MLSKPGIYGFKIWVMCDSANSYLFNAKLYCGKEDRTVEKLVFAETCL